MVAKKTFERYPAWCPRTKWNIEVLQGGEQLEPKDLFTAMLGSRRHRLGLL